MLNRANVARVAADIATRYAAKITRTRQSNCANLSGSRRLIGWGSRVMNWWSLSSPFLDEARERERERKRERE